MYDKTPFMSARYVLTRLDIKTHRGLVYISDLLPHMYLTALKRRYYVAAYINAYADWLKYKGLKAGRKSAEAFAKLPGNPQFVGNLTADIEKRFRARRWVTYRELCAFMGTSDATILKWEKEGLLARKRMPKEHVSFGTSCTWAYDIISFRDSLEWRVPFQAKR